MCCHVVSRQQCTLHVLQGHSDVSLLARSLCPERCYIRREDGRAGGTEPLIKLRSLGTANQKVCHACGQSMRAKAI